ncbi:HNH endonuclease [Comamonas sp. lk]|uniref:HNH endonuclease n=1 Tax=Comamonas sp. lk TaxID=2201272 RepID=UPI0013CF0694|nr:HNH endonuclease [Comamonas sp. lk]
MSELKAQLQVVATLIDEEDHINAANAARELVTLLEAKQLKVAHPLTKADRATGTAPSADEVRSLLDYDPETGKFHWKKKTTRRRIEGATAGTTAKEGYVSISLGYKAYKAHRLAWLYVYGSWPRGVIDHINGCKGDNRIANLRETTQRSNSHNRQGANKNSSTQILGVSRTDDGWRAQITSAGRTISLGTFSTEREAQLAYERAKGRIHDKASPSFP